MLKQKISQHACICVLNKITVPTAIGSIVLLAAKVPDIIKTANDIKKAIPGIMEIVNNYAP